eukprot:TRINITY_DN19686_c0_g1_i1.p1 TRINITY_DN19686_c0_g1~~TRINITY_DN19686_c0_g1_i1.p1  ORF type:complete len:101 (-),score=27.69 TRINITY_DN19686_c0_g1_i1:20-280(-)
MLSSSDKLRPYTHMLCKALLQLCLEFVLCPIALRFITTPSASPVDVAKMDIFRGTDCQARTVEFCVMPEIRSGSKVYIKSLVFPGQ